MIVNMKFDKNTSFDSLIINARAILDLHSLKPTANTIIGVKDGKIALITQDNNYRQYKYETLIDARGALLTPGLIDCHTHLIFAGDRAHEFKQRLDGVSYAEISKAGGGIKSTVGATIKASHQELLDIAIKRIKTMQSYGVTTVEIKSGYGLSVDSEIKILEVANQLQTICEVIPTFLGAHATPLEYSGRNDEYIELIINQMLPKVKQLGLSHVVDGFCENIGFTPKQIERLFISATQMGFKVKLHAEQLSDQKGAVLATQYDALSVDHLEYLDPEDVEYLAKSGTVAVLLPGAFYFLKETKLPPISSLREHKVPIAIATDFNPGTSPFLSLPLMMNMGCIYFGLSIAEVWQGVTINAATALGLSNQGEIKLGKQADFALWQCDKAESIVYSCTENLCIATIKRGNIVK